ncbi:cbb3-type cytochrome oxidase assembly protein CcoS [Chryseobacterium soli]|uniref:cbb3-type cytochrome oxidase assembly protein CcoS n=1 Tax=Chryseobacterium TaxID=59732 RepID=UPI002952DE1B|nr:cbb3-type cytochrome oxidase assembly protein CcoS [Chryseobacterium soli]MDV7696419.1 cbb3-type cytochrome oxidase assembly protein CcoS [Chryseobacterium soli]
MDILYLMILCSVSLAAIFLVVFIINARKGQFEDDESPAVRILFDSGEIKEDEEIVNKKTDEKITGENNKIEEKSE